MSAKEPVKIESLGAESSVEQGAVVTRARDKARIGFFCSVAQVTEKSDAVFTRFDPSVHAIMTPSKDIFESKEEPRIMMEDEVETSGRKTDSEVPTDLWSAISDANVERSALEIDDGSLISVGVIRELNAAAVSTPAAKGREANALQPAVTMVSVGEDFTHSILIGATAAADKICSLPSSMGCRIARTAPGIEIDTESVTLPRILEASI